LRGTKRYSRTRELDADALARLCEPRDDVVGERLDGTGPGTPAPDAPGVTDRPDSAVPPGNGDGDDDHGEPPSGGRTLQARFVLADGPFTSYERRIEVEEPSSPNGDRSDRGSTDGDAPTVPERRVVHETVEFALPPGTWRFLMDRAIAHALRRPAKPGRMPWWAPPARPDAHAAMTLGILATLSLVTGYLGTLLSQTMTFAADEFGASNTAQSVVLSSARIGGLLSIALTAMADRRGRRKMLVASLLVCIGFNALTAVAPNLFTLGLAQVVSRGSLVAVGLLIAIVAAEEMPAGARAYAVSLLAMTGALGAGMALWILPVADAGERAWRILYAVPLLVVPLVVRRARQLPESRRYERQHRQLSLNAHSSRLWLLAVASFLLNVFIAPQTQFRNEFLRDDRGFSAAAISLFALVTATPGGIGIVTGGRLAETLGRRLVGSVSIAVGVALIAATFLLDGWAMWIAATLGTIVFAAHVPAITVYGPELFPTSLRGRANGVIAMTAMGGSVVGLLAAGRLADGFGSFAPTMAILAVGPMLMAILIFLRFPETAQRELEDINPEDQAPGDVGQGPGSRSPDAVTTGDAPGDPG
jgi:MFS family permease